MKKSWDIFCHVIDNYGDAGVCWRLARQLAHEFDFDVRLWIDDLSVLRKFCPELILGAARQQYSGVTVCHWTSPLPESLRAADVVIEAFACELPSTYRAAMETQRSLWINLEYLSAENWVADCHGLPSPQSGSSLKKYFFFPGFRSGTGGVLSERELPQRRRAFQSTAQLREEFLRRFGLQPQSDVLTVSLFSYRDAPIEPLLRSWTTSEKPLFCLVPEGQPLASVAKFFGENLSVGTIRTRGALTVAVLPFLPQDDYDRLLWSCDLNFVRGEDSFVRAQWAAKPFVWQIYAQEDGAHWSKLDAFLDLYCEDEGRALSPSEKMALRNFWHAWNGEGDIDIAWRAYIAALSQLDLAARQWAERLESRTNLAAALVQFCANQV